MNNPTRFLKTYASGGGGISFQWIENGLAVGTPTVEEARRHFQTSDDCDGLRRSNYRVVVLNGFPLIVSDIRRVHTRPNAIIERNTVYDYTTTQPLTPDMDALTVARLTTFTFTHRIAETIIEKNVELKNISMRAGLCHFLANEAALTAQPL